MDFLIWTGAALAALGFAGVVWSIVLVQRARRANLGDDALRARLLAALPVNVGALLLSILGLVLVVTGILLG